MTTPKPYTLAGYAADRVHGDLDQDVMQATVEALDAATKRIAELEEALDETRSDLGKYITAAGEFQMRAEKAEAALLTREGRQLLMEERARAEKAEQALATVTRERDEARADFAAAVSELECEPTREDAVAEILRRERLYDEARDALNNIDFWLDERGTGYARRPREHEEPNRVAEAVKALFEDHLHCRASEARMREALERSVSTIHARCRLVAPYLPGGAACDELCCVISAALSTPVSDWLAARDRRVAEMQRADDIANLTKFREGFEEGMETGYMTMPKHAARDMLLTLEGLFETEPLVTFKPEGA